MKIEPVGVERDRQIYDLRKIVSKKLPEYSTDISAAMGLWAEMKAYCGNGEHLKLTTNGEWIQCDLQDLNCDTNINISAMGETEADAISGVYVGWKGGDNG